MQYDDRDNVLGNKNGLTYSGAFPENSEKPERNDKELKPHFPV